MTNRHEKDLVTTDTTIYNLVKHDFFNTAVADILRAIDGGALMGAAVLSFCCAAYMGVAFNPNKKKTTDSDFKKFVEKFLGEVNPKYKKLKNELWAIRNSLVHEYGKSYSTEQMRIGFSFSIDSNDSEKHLTVEGDNYKILYIDVANLVGELIGAIELFFRKNKGNDIILEEWHKRLLHINGAYGQFERLIVVTRGKPTHGESHRLLKILDKDPPPEMVTIVKEIESSIKRKVLNVQSSDCK